MHETPPHARSGRAVAATIPAYAEEHARSEDRSIIRVLAALIEHASAAGASDIHLAPTEEVVRIRLRTDGVLNDLEPLPRSLHAELIARVKVLAGLRTDEHFAAQDGRFRHASEDGVAMDVRVSIVPTYHGENAVLRLLRAERAELSLGSLGFEEDECRLLEEALLRTTGMILVTGPTGSGKTTTLYALLTLLSRPDRALVTLEDPIEYSLDGVEQIQVQTRTGLTFANGLRSLLRQDPDIIMVGEVRDRETASVAVNTALTGHLLLSTLHTNDAIATVPRLIDMGIDPYLVAATLRLVIGQRLVRSICSACRATRAATSDECAIVHKLAEEAERIESLSYGAGCDACEGTGYRGRTVIAELFSVSGPLRDAIVRKAPASELVREACMRGMVPMAHASVRKIRAGATTLEEVLRVLHD